ncbi:hypothetical protein CGRA01v4_08691 [Colletotrichum graminicola]|nr:hypothetical protein CGRA01v4_08691 [Colletotrichum graminicola]
MNPKLFITFAFISATIGAAVPSADESATSHLERRDYASCYATCLASMITRYNPLQLPGYCHNLCKRL